MKALIIYFSYTANVQVLAKYLQTELEQFADVTCAAIEPHKPRSYWGWLARSLVPGWRAAIEPTVTDLAPFDLIFLGFPKWTLSCPPLNGYLRALENARGKPVALFMCYGGFDQVRYLWSLVEKMRHLGIRIIAVQSIRRRLVRQNAYQESMREFCRRAVAWSRNSASNSIDAFRETGR